MENKVLKKMRFDENICIFLGSRCFEPKILNGITFFVNKKEKIWEVFSWLWRKTLFMVPDN